MTDSLQKRLAMMARMFPAGHIKLDKKLGPFQALPIYAPHITELFALLSGVKPVIFDAVGPGSMGEMREVCAGFRLHIQPFEDKVLQAGRTFVLIGKDRELLKKAAGYYQNLRKDYMRWGTALGYPACCVAAIRQWKGPKGSTLHRPDIVEFVFNNTPKSGQLPFLTNNVFNYFSRPGRRAGAGYDEIDRQQGAQVSRMNSRFTFSLLSIISWHPCSYFCAESLKKAKVVFDVMSYYVPEFAKVRKAALSRPVFFMDKYEFAVLNDISRNIKGGGAEITYSGLFPVKSLLDRKYLGLLENNSVIAQCAGAVRLGGKVLKPAAPFSRAPLLLPFSDIIESRGR